MSKRQFVLNAFDNKETERVPVGFWFHFVPDGLWTESEENLAQNINGHDRFYKDFDPDFVKIMSDGYFVYPNPSIADVKSAADLNRIKAVNPTEWIEKQVKLVKSVRERFGEEVATFYNIFAPATYLKWQLELEGGGNVFGPSLFTSYVNENPQAVANALNEIGKDIAALAKAVIAEGGADGIYLSAQNIQTSNLDKEGYLTYIAPSEVAILNAANEVSDYNILHICGYEGAKNDLSTYVDYPAKAVNWAAVVEGIPLEEGKKLFGGKAVIGGFDNTVKGILYKGSEQQIKAETQRLLENAGTTGVILGADCTVPSDTPLSHLKWVREAAIEFGNH